METMLHRCRFLLAFTFAVAVAGAPGCASHATRASATTVTVVALPPAVNADVEACRAGKLERCLGVAHVLDSPEADPSLRAKLAREFTPGCDHQVAEDCFRAALFADDPDTKLTRMELACTGRAGIACRMLGDTLGIEASSSDQLGQAVGFYTKGCELGDASSCLALGRTYDKGGAGLPRDVTQAEGFFKRGCHDLRDPAACRAGAELGCREGRLEDCGPPVATPVSEPIVH
jgi:hypothetical protein